MLALDAGRVVTFETLQRRVWTKRANADANLVRIFARNLRRKLGDSAASPAYLFNQRGVGYRIAKPPDDSQRAHIAAKGSGSANPPMRSGQPHSFGVTLLHSAAT